MHSVENESNDLKQQLKYDKRQPKLVKTSKGYNKQNPHSKEIPLNYQVHQQYLKKKKRTLN